MKKVELYVDHLLRNDPHIKEIQLTLKKKKFVVRMNFSAVFSYQGGRHGSNPPPHPDDWEGESSWGPSDAERHTPYSAHDGDLLVCIRTADRYGYSQERNLILKEFKSSEEALKWVKEL